MDTRNETESAAAKHPELYLLIREYMEKRDVAASPAAPRPVLGEGFDSLLEVWANASNDERAAFLNMLGR